MRRQSQVEVTETARRRLELLRRELSNAGIEPVRRGPADDDRAPEVGEVPPGPTGTPADPAAVAPAGRHLRRTPGRAERATGWLEDRLPSTMHGRVGLGTRELAVLAVVVAVGLALAAVVVLRSGAGREPVAPTSAPTTGVPGALLSVAPTGPATAQTGAPPGSPSGSPATGAAVTVDVAGKVRRPGVVTLPAGSRVVDALRRAGGPRGRVDLTGLNLARVLSDGEQILVGRPAVGVAASAAGTVGASPGGPLVNLNTATQDELEELPGVGPVTAQKILAWRSAHGVFSSVDELLEVDGIGDKTLADLAPYVTV